MPEGLAVLLSGPALSMLAVGVLILLLGVVGVARDRVTPETVSFFLLAATTSWWLTTAAVMMMTVDRDAALAWARILYVAAPLVPATVLQFSYALTGELRRKRETVTITWTISVMFVALFTMTDLFIVDMYHYSWGHYAKLGPFTALFLLFIGVVLTTSVLALRRAHSRRASSFLLALAVGYLSAIDFLPSFGIDILPLGHLAVFGFIVLSTRTIRRYRFVDLGPSFVAEQLLETVQGGVIVVDMPGVIRVANPTAAALLAQPGSLVGASLRTLLDVPSLPLADTETFARVGRARNQPMTWTRRDGAKVEVSVSATLLRDQEQIPVGILYVMHDLSERRRAERHEFAANHDALTGMPNRAYLENRFEQVVSEIAGHGRSAAVLFLDLDGFKRVNDEHGHGVGDRLLQLVASRLRNALRDDDTLARYGGDEFIVLLSIRRDSDAQIVADKLLRVMRDPFAVDALTLRIGASIGVAVSPRDGTSMDALVHVADDAMYRAKREQGRPSQRNGTDKVASSPFGAESRA
jgi:diguanylate cyclase (GGDEF)-like protein/PAS domain S-box-containing protein